MSERVYAIASVYEDAGLLPHFLDHYTRLGVERLFIVVRTPVRDALFDGARKLARQYPASVDWFPSAYFADSDKAEVEAGVLRENGLEPDDYVMHLDLDEFQEYPAPLAEIVALMNDHDDWALRGWIVDRVAAGGRLPAIRPEPTLGEQFPIGCDLTENLLRAWTQKIMLCRGRVELQGGVRHDTLNAFYDRVPLGRSEDYTVHHFKWSEGVDARLRERLRKAAVAEGYKHECTRFLESFETHGSIDLNHPGLNPRWLGPLSYPSESVLLGDPRSR